MRYSRFLYIGLFGVMVGLLALNVPVLSQATDPLADWGDDHVGKPRPDFVTGDECLFCHREKVGTAWANNYHNRSMTNVHGLSPTLQALVEAAGVDDIMAESAYLLGRESQMRFLKPNGKYGQYAIHSTRLLVEADGTLKTSSGAGHWDNDSFANRCIGCHTTAIDPEYKSFETPSLDCMVCHGDTPQGHQNEPDQALFAKKGTMDPRVEMSICGQCHLRGGVSRSTGLPYPTSFVGGDNLFKDFEMNFSDEAIDAMSIPDRHVFQNVRDVLLNGMSDMTYMTCHDIHDQSSRKHKALKRLERESYCMICHSDNSDYLKVYSYEEHNSICDY